MAPNFALIATLLLAPRAATYADAVPTPCGPHLQFGIGHDVDFVIFGAYLALAP